MEEKAIRPAAGAKRRTAPTSRLYDDAMCRNITELRGLEPPATREEIEAASSQYVRKVTGVVRPNPELARALDQAAAEIAQITERLLTKVPARRQPPKSVPPLRRPEVRKRMGLSPLSY
jgi:hypothetical protein